ncbi:hypothetical protein TNCV_959001 [Trichonephila clavipes]|nr:hypothetical protein TNCV_959001 [Trichonephila clavipes]
MPVKHSQDHYAPAWTVPTMVAGCLFPEVSRRTDAATFADSSLGDTVGSPLVHLGGQLPNGGMSIRPNVSLQPSLTSVIYSPWCTLFVMSLILESSILPCMVYFNHGDTRTV